MSKVWAVSMMRDEEDVAYHVLQHLHEERVDGIIVADNRSTDGTRDELERAKRDFRCRIMIVDDPVVAYLQAEKMTRLAALAAEQGADWIVPFDADELWVSRQAHLGETLRKLHHSVNVAQSMMVNHFATDRDDLSDPNPFTRLRWRHPEWNPMGKVAFRWREGARLEQGNHEVHWDGDRTVLEGDLLIHHFPARSGEHLTRKARNGAEAYRAADLPDDMGAHWRQWGDLLDANPNAMHEVFAEHYTYPDPESHGMVEDPAPWCRWTR